MVSRVRRVDRQPREEVDRAGPRQHHKSKRAAHGQARPGKRRTIGRQDRPSSCILVVSNGQKFTPPVVWNRSSISHCLALQRQFLVLREATYRALTLVFSIKILTGASNDRGSSRRLVSW